MQLLESPYRVPSVYELADGLRASPDVEGVLRTEPGESDREELLLRKLGARGWGRFYHFRYFYGPGWGEGHGQPLSPRATEAFFRFIDAVEFPESVRPSLFLTDEGGLELAWENVLGEAVQAAFLPWHIEVYRASDGLDETLPLSDAEQVGKRLTNS